MNINIQKAIDILEQGKFKRVTVAVEKTDRVLLEELVNDYIEGGFDNSKGWKDNVSSKKEIDYINYLVFDMTSNGKILMYRQHSEPDIDRHGYFFPSGTFFTNVKYKKKKLEL